MSSDADEVRESPVRRKAQEVLGVVVVAVAGYFLLALLTYPGLDGSGQVVGDNLMGPVGNGVARWTLAAVGLSVYPLLLVMVGIALKLILGRGLKPNAPLLLAAISWAVSMAVIFHVAFRGTAVHGEHLAGGAVGELLGEVLCSLFSETGTYLFAGVMVLVTAMLATNLSVAAWVRLSIRVAKWVGRTSIRCLDKLGALVIGVAEQWEHAEDDDGGSDRTDIVVSESTEDEAAPPKTTPSKKAKEPKVSRKRQSKQASKDESATFEVRPLADHEGWILPSASLLDEPRGEEAIFEESELKIVASKLNDALTDYGVSGEVTEIHPGPVVTLFEYVPKSGTKLSKISGLKDELSMRLEVERVRIVAPIPGKNAVGFEVPNTNRAMVGLRRVLHHVLKKNGKKMALPLALGRDIGGTPLGVDLAKMPHLIVAGTTGSGKSVCINALLLSLLYRHPPQDLRLILIDPKEVELGGYDEIPHLLVPVVTDMSKAASALRWAVDEMERRYDLFANLGVRNLASCNKKIETRLAKGTVVSREEKGGIAEISEVAGAAKAKEPEERLPYIVIVLDELADLMMVAAREVETAIARLAQKARAAGIHLVVATQRPSTDVMSGTIRNNFPARISFRVATGIDSRTVLDTQGAESLLGAGDMLIRPPGTGELIRVHGAYVSEEEVERVVEYLKNQGTPKYEDAVFSMPAEEEAGASSRRHAEDDKYAEKYDLAVELVTIKRRASVSFIQRHLRVGYNTAARLMERMEQEGVVGPERGSRPREVLVNPPPELG